MAQEENSNKGSEKSGVGERIAELFNRTWEMEILLFGFVLVFLWQLPDRLDLWEEFLAVQFKGGMLQGLSIFLGVLRMALYITIAGMGLHLVLRGFWIAVVGLNSVYPKGADIDSLRLNSRFQRHLDRKVASLSGFAEKLDDVCSANFALTFLLVFAWWSLMIAPIMGVAAGALFNYFLTYPLSFLGETAQVWASPSFLILLILIWILLVLYAFDFLTNGRVKRIRAKWFAVPYFYWYRFMNIVTLSFLYRPLYYTFITRRRRKLLPGLVFALVLLGIFLGGVRFHPWMYHGDASVDHYSDRIPDTELIKDPVIPRKKVASPYLRVFVPYNMPTYRIKMEGEAWRVHDDLIAEFCEGTKPFFMHRLDFFESIRIVEWGLPLIESMDGEEEEDYHRDLSAADRRRVLNCLDQRYQFWIDSIPMDHLGFRFHVHERNQLPGFLTYIPLKEKEAGWHRLKVLISARKGDRKVKVGDAFPFFYAPESKTGVAGPSFRSDSQSVEPDSSEE